MSVVEQLRQMVPAQWPLKPLRSVADYQVSNVDKLIFEDEEPVRLCNYVDVYHNEMVDLTVPFMTATATAGEIERFGLNVGDVLITKDSESWNDIGVPALICETADDLVCGYHLAMIRPNPDQIEGEFLFRCMQAKPVGIQLELAANGITRFGIPKSAIGSLSIPVPPISDQRRIVGYIADHVQDIDALIDGKQKLLGLLAEKRRTLVAEAVMRGLDRSAPLRPSGIDWLGHVPAHWEIRRSKWLFEERDVRSTTGEEALFSLRMERGLVPHNEVSEKKTLPEELVGYKIARQGELVVNRMRAATGLIAIAPEHGLVSPDYAVFVPSTEIECDYYVELFKTTLLQAVFRSESTGLGTGSQGFLRLYSQNFLALWFPYPPIEEQRQILEHLNVERAKIDKLSTATQRSIALLKERRSTLIAAAVTGQIEIPEAA